MQLARFRKARPCGAAFGSRSGGCHAARMFYPFHRFHPCESLLTSISVNYLLSAASRNRFTVLSRPKISNIS